MQQIKENWKAPISPFFRTVRNIGLLLTGLSAALLTAPLALPALVTTIAGYIAVAGSVAATISQFTVDNSNDSLNENSVDHGKPFQ